MAWQATRLYYASGVRVEKFINGTMAVGYPKNYSILPAFTYNSVGYAAITTDAWQKLDSTNRSSRMTAFKGYVSAIEDVDISSVQTNAEYYSTETPDVRQILISGMTIYPYSVPIAIVHIPSGGFSGYFDPAQAIIISSTEDWGEFVFMWETTEADYKIDEYPYIMALISQYEYKVMLKPSYADAVADGINFDTVDWEGM